ncbi:DNA-binding transcriptional regulator, LysR family [Promicromonospora umidemergens]|uniref:LysR family transcriptional regulator n=1 Tax=Promicromonospora umidemergens TaxID=629679 RepID=A0ABP8XVY7_9MICO|nr:LysR family transcriptional regulator [Promicromonospora umidemergens]MCP2286259.1 DNA-binding transcriptional regulator, LysR family [Promicromonospora umidemergens]
MPARNDPPAGQVADQLLVLLEVARTGRYTTAAQALGVNHTTVARNITALERALGGRLLVRGADGWELTSLGRRAARAGEAVSDAVDRLVAGDTEADPITGVVRMTATDGFSAYVASPAIARLRGAHPELSVELVTVTRVATHHRSGVDVDVVVGQPSVQRAKALLLGEYVLGMYGSRDYLARHGTPATVAEMSEHGLVYFVDSMLQVNDLDAPRRLVPGMQDALASTNVFVHVEATRAGAGLGFLPCFMADRHDDLVRLLPDEVTERLPYWAVIRSESWRRPAVAAVVQALLEEMARQRDRMLGLDGAA